MATAAQTQKALATIKSLRFGTEIEFTGLSRERAIHAVMSVVAPNTHVSRGYDHGLEAFTVVDSQDRKWKVVSDSSVAGSTGNNGGEFVTPPLGYDDIELLQAAVRALRAAGARVDGSCGQHVHVDGAAFKASPKKIRNLVALTHRWEHIFLASCPLAAGRSNRWCQNLPASVVSAYENDKTNTLASASKAWYGTNSYGCQSHYHPSRYHWVNLHSLFNGHGTVEFRVFNGSLHAGHVRANIVLALSIAACALNSRSVSFKASGINATKTGMQGVMGYLGMVGEDFKVVRKHLTRFLPKGPAFAVAAE